jgi:Oxidoreductase molybdopterin binding domain
MKGLCSFFVLLFALVFSSAALQCQQLTIQTDSGKQVVLSRADLEALPRIKVTASEHSSGPVTFEGVSLKSVLEKAGVSFGEAMKGPRLANCLLVEAADGYRVVIALPELDPAFTDKQTALVFLRDGKPLGEKEGPYRIVIPDDKRMARWVRQVTALKIIEVK